MSLPNESWRCYMKSSMSWAIARGVLGREVTKLHEEIIRGRLSDIADRLKDRSEIKGECTLLVAGMRQ